MKTQSLTFEQFVNAPASQVYQAFTNATLLREWMCDLATLVPHPGGRLYMAWNSGFFMVGEFTRLEPFEAIAFTWSGRYEPAPTRVHITLVEKDGGSLVRLVHEGVGVGEAWENTIKEIQDGWKGSLENLASVLETGADLRITLRPMLGISIGDFTSEQASSLGVPVTTGIRIDSTLPGMGAQAAGLQRDDVIVGMAGQAITDFASLSNALQGKRAGDCVEVVFYRGGQNVTVSMELSHRRIPAIPATLKELAEALKRKYADQRIELEKFFAGVSDAEASFKPSAEDWSAKEVLAHLIQGERLWPNHVSELVGAQESWADDFAGNLDAWIRATVSACPSLEGLLDQLENLYAETIALFENLPEELQQRKGTYWRLAYEALEAPYHLQAHIQQMQIAIDKARAR